MSRGGRRGRWAENGFEGMGGYMAAKKAKLEGQFSEEAKKEGNQGIFDGVAIFVNGYSDPSGDELKRIMMMNGGIYHHYFNAKKTTHVIATNLPDTKVKALKGDEPICHPRWIVESLEAGKLLDYRKYLLYTRQTKSQPMINFAPLPSKRTKDENPSIESGVKTVGEEKSPEVNSARREGKALDASDTNFLGEFYKNSRLHHISTMGAEFKCYVAGLREKHDGFFPDRGLLRDLVAKSSSTFAFSGGNRRSDPNLIMHVDMDCFFVSVGLLARPDLIGKPVAVAHAKNSKTTPVSLETIQNRKAEVQLYRNRESGNISGPVKVTPSDLVEFSSMSELASCSYEARAAGVRNGMFLGQALKLCPGLKTIPYDFEGYQRVARGLYDTVARFTLDVQAVSCDELLAQVSDLLIFEDGLELDPLDFAEFLRGEIKKTTRCNASVGLGSNPLLARMATKRAKPNGAFLLTEADAVDGEFMLELPVRDLPGVGRKTARRLGELGASTCGQLRQLSLPQLKREFGTKTGQALYDHCRGRDDRKVETEHERKSVSAEVNYGIRFKSEEEWMTFLDQLAGEVSSRLERLSLRGRRVTMKLLVRASEAPQETSKFLGHGVCDSISRSGNFMGGATREKKVIAKEIKVLARQLEVKYEDLRGVGVQVSKLEKSAMPSTSSMLTYLQKNAKGSPISEEVQEKKSPIRSNNISWSDIDLEVLSALPEDIRKEVEESLRRTRSMTSELTGGPSGGTVQLEERAQLPPSPGPSRKPSEQQQRKSLLEATFSQLDPEYLAELPDDIAKEVQEELAAAKKSKEAAAGSNKPNAFDALMTVSTKSPSRQTPSKRGPGGKRGRPPKNSPRFIKNRTKTSPKGASRELFVDKINQELEGERDEVAESIATIEPRECPCPSLNGRTDLEGVRELLRLWLRVTTCPTEDDVGTVSDFMRQLVRHKRTMYDAVILLRTLLRRAETMSEEWQLAAKTVATAASEEVMRVQGCRLNLAIS